MQSFEVEVPDLSECSDWYLVQTKPRQVSRARLNLERQSFQVFVPERDETIRRQERFVTERRPLFPNYVFVRVEQARSWFLVRSTFGVARVVAFGASGPTGVPPKIMRALFARFVDSQMQPDLRAGMEVRILQGPLSQFIARIEEAPEPDRVRILFDLVCGTMRTTVAREALEVL